ncbi:esterase FE4-like [Trichogramma pretiosum]|uniref:esterase FE4-like n=1 Tax=Trichogramma pretiosum TaxID=7493 RepID=UPI0006C9A486|nr:esterase FE4-like [Trichogramma pretiosum]
MESPVVSTSYGQLCGLIEKSFEGYNYYAFKGVPYAKPPIGDLRFEEPQLLIPWEGIREAKNFGSPCAQFDQLTRTFIGSDDCLYLNIYTKNLRKTLPVMVWIHGGAYTFGCGDDMFYGSDYLLKNDIVLVTVNYRVGVLGFFNLEDEIAPGNQGLKDLVFALKWIQLNISKFGGDSSNVTIFGESSGGASVNYLGLSPMAKGLFHKAISQSGVALNTWASTPNPRSYGFKLCKILGQDLHDSREAIAFLRKIDCLKLAKMQEKMRTLEERFQLLYPFGPGTDSKAKNPFMPIPIEIAAENGMNVPYLVGFNEKEGNYSYYTVKSHPLKDICKNFVEYLHPNIKVTLKKHKLTPYDLRTLYKCHDDDLTEENYCEKIADLLEDMYLVEGVHRMIKHQVNNNTSPVYYYKFTYDKGVSFTKLMLNIQRRGASHFDELSYLFSMRFNELLGIEPLQKGTESYRLMEQMTEMWTNFAKFGRPTIDASNLIKTNWVPVTNPTLLRFLEIGESLKMDCTINIDQKLSYSNSFKNKL